MVLEKGVKVSASRRFLENGKGVSEKKAGSAGFIELGYDSLLIY